MNVLQTPFGVSLHGFLMLNKNRHKLDCVPQICIVLSSQSCHLVSSYITYEVLTLL